MSGEDIVTQLEKWCVEQMAKSAAKMEIMKRQIEGKITSLEGRMNGLSTTICAQVASDVSQKLDAFAAQVKMDMADLKDDIKLEVFRKEEFYCSRNSYLFINYIYIYLYIYIINDKLILIYSTDKDYSRQFTKTGIAPGSGRRSTVCTSINFHTQTSNIDAI